MKKISSLQEIEKITGGDVNTLKELLIVFIEEALKQIQKLEAYSQTKDIQELKNTAHKMKSSFILIGLNSYNPIVEEIEMIGEKDPQKTAKQVAELLLVYTQAIKELKGKLKELS